MANPCKVTSLANSSCCAAAEESQAVIDNPPGQSALRYRLGTFHSFRRAMLAAAAKRLPQWKDHGQRDYGVALLEMWATLGDILSFYQERIANEAFLPTAVLRESVARLGALVDYRLNPGVAANAYLAFQVDKGKTCDIPKGFRAQSKPAPGTAPVPFETSEALTAYASLNLIRPQWLEDQTLGFGAQYAILEGTKTKLKPGGWILIVGEERLKDPGCENWDLRQLTEVVADPGTDTTKVRWDKGLGHVNPKVEPAAEPKIYALRTQAWPFGCDAPDHDSLAYTATQTTGTHTSKIDIEPSIPDWKGKCLPENPDYPDQIFLDRLYPALLANSWVVLATGEAVNVAGATKQGYVEAYRVLKVDETVHANYTLNGKVTRLTVDTVPAAGGKQQPENIDVFPIKGTAVLAQSEELKLAQVKVSEPMAGDTLGLDASYPDLKPGRLLAITGLSPDGQATGEVVFVKEVSGSQITLQTSLRHSYDAASVAIYGNVAEASQGETVAEEILGSGDAARLFQRFGLKKTPLTFVRASGPDANRWGTQAELEVRVGGVLWKPRDNLLGSGAAERVYTLDIAADDQAAIAFGAGLAEEARQQDALSPVPGGARLPSGHDNVRARYRKGLGVSGNVQAGTVTTLVGTKPGLKSVGNPLAGTGGTDRESAGQVKTKLPTVMRAFDRAVSLEDYAALARSYTGVAKAQAFWEHTDPADPTGRRRLEQPKILLTVAATDKTPPLQPAFKKALRGFLDARRDPNQPMDIIDFTPVSVDVSVTVQAEAEFLPEKVRADVAAALSAGQNPDGSLGLFAFDRLDFGMALHLSEIYAAVQAVPGVRAVRVDKFQTQDADPTAAVVEAHIFIPNTKIVRCDNDPANAGGGILKIDIAESL